MRLDPNFDLNGPNLQTIVLQDAVGNIVVADRENHRIHILTKEGEHVAFYGMLGSGVNELDCPLDVKLYDNGLIVVLDAKNKRIIMY